MTKGRTLQEFDKAHDKVAQRKERIEAALKALGESWLYEIEFAREAKVGLQAIKQMREHYTSYLVQVKVPGERGRYLWCGTTKFASALRARVAK